MKKVLDNIAFWVIYGVWYALSLLPLWVHYVFSDILYVLTAFVLRYRRRVIWKNLTRRNSRSCNVRFTATCVTWWPRR